MSKCDRADNDCQYHWSSSETPVISSIVQNQLTLSLFGTGFSSFNDENQVLINMIDGCRVISSTSSSIVCVITNVPSGNQTVHLNVLGRGLASSSTNFMVYIPMEIHWFSPSQGGAGFNATILFKATVMTTFSSRWWIHNDHLRNWLLVKHSCVH